MRFLFIYLFLFLMVASCTESKKSDYINKIESHLQNDDNYVITGLIDFKNLKEKSRIKEIKGLDSFAQNLLLKLEEVVEDKSPIYFAFSAVSIDNYSGTKDLFFEIKNEKKFLHFMEDLGLVAQKEINIYRYKVFNTMILSDGKIGVISYNYEDVEKFQDLFQSGAKEKIKNSNFPKRKNDIYARIRLESFVGNLFENKKGFNLEKVKSLREELKKGWVTLNGNFNNGDIEFSMEVEGFSEEFQGVITKIFLPAEGQGLYTLGDDVLPYFNLALHLSVSDLEQFLETYLVDEKELSKNYREFFHSYGDRGALIASIAQGSLTNLTNGNIYISLALDPNETILDVINTPLLFYSFGWGKERQNVMDFANTMAINNGYTKCFVRQI